MGSMKAPVLKGQKMVLVPILRAGMGLLDGMLEMFPSARVAGKEDVVQDGDVMEFRSNV